MPVLVLLFTSARAFVCLCFGQAVQSTCAILSALVRSTSGFAAYALRHG